MTVAHSLIADPGRAAEVLADETLAALGGQAPTAGVLFVGVGQDAGTLRKRLLARFPRLSLIGGLTQGEVSRRNGYRYGSALLIAFASDSIQIDAASWKHPAQASLTADRVSAPLRLLLLLTAPQCDWTVLRRALANRYPEARVFGLTLGAEPEPGTAAAAPGVSPIFHRDDTWAGMAVALGFRGPQRFSWGLANGLDAGWLPLGEPMDATVEGSCILSLDGHPPAAHLRARDPAWPENSPLQPLALLGAEPQDPVQLAPVLASDPATGALHLPEPLPPGIRVQPTEPDPVALRQAAHGAMQQALGHYPDLAEPAGALWFSTRHRLLALDGHPADEYQSATTTLLERLPVAGGYGEALASFTADRHQRCPYAQLVLLLGEEPHLEDAAAKGQLLDSRLCRLREDNQRLQQELDAARRRLAELERQRQWEGRVSRIAANARTEKQYFHRALALESLCRLLEQRFDDLRRHVLIGEPPRVNRSALVRLIRREHQARTGEEFPLKEAALGRLLGRNLVTSQKVMAKITDG